jgi:23S rRNA pseudouridine1911/1915/1917 synthase
VHLAGVGLPLVGDPVYGEPRWKGMADAGIREACEAFPRQALHAWRVQLAHPESGARLSIVAPPPADLQALLDVTGLAGAVAESAPVVRDGVPDE